MRETLAILPSAKGGCTALIIQVQLRKGSVTRDFKDCSLQKFTVLFNPFPMAVFFYQFCSPTANKLSINGGESEQSFFFFGICVQYP